MDTFKELLNFIISSASSTDVPIVVSLLIFYLAVIAALFLIKIFGGMRK